MRTGETKKIRIKLRGGKPGESIVLEVLGATTMNSESSIIRNGHQALTYDPIVDVTLRAMQDGTPTIVVSSPEKRFESVAVNGHQILLRGPGDIILDSLPPPQKEALPEEPAMPDVPTITPNFIVIKKKSWLPMIAGALTFFLIAGIAAWWWTYRNETPTEPVAEASPDEYNNLATMTEAEEADVEEVEVEPVVAIEETPTPVAEPVVESKPEPTPEPPSPAEEPAVVNPSAPDAPAAEPTNCTFLNGNRPMVGNKFILQCADGQYVAIGTYVIDHFEWSDFEKYLESK